MSFEVQRKIVFIVSSDHLWSLYAGLAMKVQGVDSVSILFLLVDDWFKDSNVSPQTKEVLLDYGDIFELPRSSHLIAVRKIMSILNEDERIIFIAPHEYEIIFTIINYVVSDLRCATIHLQHALWSSGKFLPGYNTSSNYIWKRRWWADTLKGLLYRLKQIPIDWLRIKLIQLQYKWDYKNKRVFPLTSNYFACVSDAYAKQASLEVEYNSNNIRVVGYQRLFYFINDNFDVYKHHNIGNSTNLYVYFYAPFYLFPSKFIEQTSSLLAAESFYRSISTIESDFTVIYLVHPNALVGMNDLASHLKNETEGNYIVTQSYNHQGAYMKKARMIGAAKSAAILEAHFLNVPVLYQHYVLKLEQDINLYDKENICVVRDIDEECAQIKTYLNKYESKEIDENIYNTSDCLKKVVMEI